MDRLLIALTAIGIILGLFVFGAFKVARRADDESELAQRMVDEA